MTSNNDDQFDPFKGSSGLADDVDVTWENVHFGQNPTYTDGDGAMPVVFMALETYSDLEFEAREQLYTIGKGWEVQDKGAKVVREDGRSRGFNNSTRLQTLLNRFLELDEDAMRKRYEATGLTPQEAGYWEGFTWHGVIEAVEVGFGDNKKTRDQLVPDKVIGWSGGKVSGAAKKAPAKKAAASKKAAAKAATPVDEATEDTADASSNGQVTGAELAKVKLAIRAIADECDTFDEYVDRCYSEVDEASTDGGVAALIDDDEVGSIWADAVEAAAS